MKQSIKINFDIKVKNFTISNFNLEADAEYSEEEMRAEGDVFVQALESLVEKFSWLQPLVERMLEAEAKTQEIMLESLEKSIETGKVEVTAPHYWSVKSEPETTED